MPGDPVKGRPNPQTSRLRPRQPAAADLSAEVQHDPRRVQAPPTRIEYQPRHSNAKSRRLRRKHQQRTRMIHVRTSDRGHVSRPNRAPRRPTARRSSHQQGLARPRSKTRPPPTKIPPTPKPQTTPPSLPQDAARPHRTRPGCSRHSASSRVFRSSLTNPPPVHQIPNTPPTTNQIPLINQCSHRPIRLFRFLKDSRSPPSPPSPPHPPTPLIPIPTPSFSSLAIRPAHPDSCPRCSPQTQYQTVFCSYRDNVHSQTRNVR